MALYKSIINIVIIIMFRIELSIMVLTIVVTVHISQVIENAASYLPLILYLVTGLCRCTACYSKNSSPKLWL